MKNQDELLSEIRDSLPSMWFSLYQGCLDTGFNESQAFNLIQTHVLGLASGGIRPNSENGPDSNK